MVSDPANLRAGDADRDRIIAVLREAFSQGRLSDGEFNERMAGAASARTYGELEALTTDLPLHEVVPSLPVPIDEAELEHRRRARRNMWISWLTASLVTTLIWLLTARGDEGWGYFWPIWVIGPWGVVLLVKSITNSDN